MLYYDFKNYEEFKEIFGIIEHGNGVKSRKNKILLALYKDRDFLRTHIRSKEYRSLYDFRNHLRTRYGYAEERDSRNISRIRFTIQGNNSRLCDFSYEERFLDLLGCISLPQLKTRLLNHVLQSDDERKSGAVYRMSLMGRSYYTDCFETDDMAGLCEDGTLNAIRYRNIEKNRVFKMKAGRIFNTILSCNLVTRRLPEQIKRWLSEEFVADWIDYARENIGETEYTLHVDDNFHDIYSSDCCAGYDEDSDSFGSCMVNDDQYEFYENAVSAKAAYLTGEDDLIYARCILFTDVIDQDGKKWRLAERQYSKYSDPSLQRQLVSALIKGGYIDGYKRVGASCHDNRAFVDNEGNSLEDRRFKTRCYLEEGDTLSYQDSFVYFDGCYADNYGNGTECLNSTDSEFEGIGEWSDYNDERIPRERAIYVDTRNDYFWDHQVVEAKVYDGCSRWYWENCFEDDCIDIDGAPYYAGKNGNYPEEYGISECPQCGERFISGDYSEVTEEEYCCSGCRLEAEESWYEDNGWVQSEYSDEWYESEDELITANRWQYYYCGNALFEWRYIGTTIGIDEFNRLVERGRATEFCGQYYIDDLLADGEPAHLLTQPFKAVA